MSTKSNNSAVERQAEIAQSAKELFLKSGNCAQASFAVLCQEYDLEGDQILKALTAFPGLALRGETCGAVIGSLMALGLVYGRDDLADWRGYLGSLPSARKFCKRFEAENGGTACSAILQTKLGRSFDLANGVEVIKYSSAGGPQVCAEVVASAVLIASKGIERKKRRAT